jgi:hypothetical protein
MEKSEYQFGDLVAMITGEWKDHAGIVSWPISKDSTGYVLIYSDGFILGIKASSADVMGVDDSYTGFTQLTSHLIKLSSHLIEKAILVGLKSKD